MSCGKNQSSDLALLLHGQLNYDLLADRASSGTRSRYGDRCSTSGRSRILLRWWDKAEGSARRPADHGERQSSDQSQEPRME